uniref:Reverse transcriptase zinc-binding domain-containing protein n=1 Tax=Rhodnius prolixus TaxID=13249 RepID=T1HH82_RHOPR
MAVQRSILLLMGRYSRTTSTEALQVLTGCLPLDMEVVRAAVRYGLRRGIEVRVPMLRALRLSMADMTEDYRLWFRERMYGEVEEELNREWRNRWRASTKGRTTFSFVPDAAGGRRLVSTEMPYAVARLVTGHGMLRAKMFEMGLATDPYCACGDPETAEHIIMECDLYDDLRCIMWRRVGFPFCLAGDVFSLLLENASA